MKFQELYVIQEQSTVAFINQKSQELNSQDTLNLRIIQIEVYIFVTLGVLT